MMKRDGGVFKIEDDLKIRLVDKRSFHKGPFVQIWREAGFCGDTSIIRQVSDRDPSKIRVPEYYLGFHFFDLELDMRVEIEDGNRFRTRIGGEKRINKSPTYFVGGQLITLADLRRDSKQAELLAAMEDDPRVTGWVRQRYWKFYFRDGDAILPPQNDDEYR